MNPIPDFQPLCDSHLFQEQDSRDVFELESGDEVARRVRELVLEFGLIEKSIPERVAREFPIGDQELARWIAEDQYGEFFERYTKLQEEAELLSAERARAFELEDQQAKQAIIKFLNMRIGAREIEAEVLFKGRAGA